MPTYEYVCPKCGHEFEQFQSMRDEPLKKCPKCKKMGLKRLVGSGAGLIFKGSGFYITDYKNTAAKTDAANAAKAASPKTEAPKSEAPKSDAGTKSSGGSEKSAAKSSSKTAK
ncbi:zinc ribbon domain-containing protein [Horticoccus luteus]|uniref:Zinc ribbon domain-containing protein n=1 Tax=Horticoccus luteus TaxID=2862869 RepID=A0A8F9XMX1_9BACT|nr:zinc ribbon domain-containing protein [Horticoccus luteus]QYM80756.1 zinc ribbon domain-containing protein [Horticoccus luteus]